MSQSEQSSNDADPSIQSDDDKDTSYDEATVSEEEKDTKQRKKTPAPKTDKLYRCPVCKVYLEKANLMGLHVEYHQTKYEKGKEILNDDELKALRDYEELGTAERTNRDNPLFQMIVVLRTEKKGLKDVETEKWKKTQEERKKQKNV